MWALCKARLLHGILVSVQDDRQGSKILCWVGLLEDRRGLELDDLPWQKKWQAVSPATILVGSAELTQLHTPTIDGSHFHLR